MVSCWTNVSVSTSTWMVFWVGRLSIAKTWSFCHQHRLSRLDIIHSQTHHRQSTERGS